FNNHDTPNIVKIGPPTLQSAAFALDLSPPSPPRPLSPRSHRSHLITIRELPNSSSLLCGPRLSPPPPVRFRALAPFSHHRAASAPIRRFTAHPPTRGLGHSRTNSSPPSSGAPQSTHDSLNHGSAKLCNSNHCDLPVRGAGTRGLRDLCDSEQSEPVCEAGEGAGRRRMTRTVRFQIDEKEVLPPSDEPAERSLSGLLRSEDERRTWF
ncbi:hypothetical protein A1O1_08271, partial [Capronia coronata CBS 617.96]